MSDTSLATPFSVSLNLKVLFEPSMVMVSDSLDVVIVAGLFFVCKSFKNELVSTEHDMLVSAPLAPFGRLAVNTSLPDDEVILSPPMPVPNSLSTAF